MLETLACEVQFSSEWSSKPRSRGENIVFNIIYVPGAGARVGVVL